MKKPKIIIGGMGKRLEAWFDPSGDYMAGKSTVVVSEWPDALSPYYLLGLLNSRLMSFFVNEIYSVVAMGRSINFGKNNVGGLPIPLVADEIQYEIGQLAERLQTLASDAADVNGSEYQTCLNRLNILVDDVFGMDG